MEENGVSYLEGKGPINYTSTENFLKIKIVVARYY